MDHFNARYNIYKTKYIFAGHNLYMIAYFYMGLRQVRESILLKEETDFIEPQLL